MSCLLGALGWRAMRAALPAFELKNRVRNGSFSILVMPAGRDRSISPPRFRIPGAMDKLSLPTLSKFVFKWLELRLTFHATSSSATCRVSPTGASTWGPPGEVYPLKKASNWAWPVHRNRNFSGRMSDIGKNRYEQPVTGDFRRRRPGSDAS